MKVRNVATLFVFAAIIAMLFLLGCEPRSVGDIQPTPSSITAQPIQPITTVEPVIEMGPGAASYVTAQSFEQLVAESTVICIGEMTGLGETFNMARNPQDTTQPDPNILGLGQVYHFRVERYLKGQSSNTIDIVQVEAFLTNRVPWTPENIEKAKAKDSHIPLRLGVKYLYFLRPLQDFPDKQNYFVGTRHPWRFILPDKGNAEPESPWSGAKQVFRSRPSAEVIGEVEFWVNGGRVPTPTRFPTLPAPLATPTRRPYP